MSKVNVSLYWCALQILVETEIDHISNFFSPSKLALNFSISIIIQHQSYKDKFIKFEKYF